MKKNILSRLFALMIVVALLSGCSSDTSESKPKADPGVQSIIDAGKLKAGIKVDVPGFGYQNTETGKYEGVEVDLAYRIAADIFGVTPEEAKEKDLVEFQGVTAKTRGPLLDNGELDVVVATFTITDERKESWNFSTPYYTDAVGLMTLKDTGYETMKDIDGAIIGVAQGSTTKDSIEAYIKEQGLEVQVEFQEFDGYPALSAALSSGNIDIFSVDRAILTGYNDDTTKILPERFGTQDYGIATALYAKELAGVTDKVVKDLVDSGEMEKMISDWGIE